MSPLKKSKGVLFAFAGVLVITLYLIFFVPKSYLDVKFLHPGEEPGEKVVAAALTTTIKDATKNDDPLYCYKSKGVESLPDIAGVTPPPKKNSIFFIETSCRSSEGGKITVQRRQACSVESAAHSNPNSTVYLLYVSPGNLKLEGTESDRLLEALLSYKNVNLMHVNFEEYARDSPAENVFDEVRASKHAQSHASDMLRFLTLWKYGGFYLDLDVVVLKPLEDLAATFTGAESETNVGSAILRFDPSGVGREFARKCVEDFARNYRPNEWGYNGPGVLTRMMTKLCGGKELKEAFNRSCEGVTLYPPPFFFPVSYPSWRRYFEEKYTEEVMRDTGDSYAVHIWNKLSETNPIPSNANVAYIKFAQKYCPKVYRQSTNHF